MIRQIIGTECRDYRRNLGYTLAEVSQDVYMSPSAVHSFEMGERDSGTILLWYIAHGLDFIGIMRKFEDKIWTNQLGGGK